MPSEETAVDEVDATDPNDALARFGALVLADEAMQARLGGILSAERFVAEATALAAEHGIRLDRDRLAAAIRPDLLGINRFMPAPVTLEGCPSRGWLPARSVPTGAAPAFDWAWFGAARLRRPFYEEEVRHFATRPFNEMFRTRTSLRALVADAHAGDPRLAGLVFHMSRCGSTLVAQMLAAEPSHVVLSEPEPLDAVIRWALESGAPFDEQVAAVRAVIAALGRDRAGTARRVFVKVDSWHAIALPLFRAAFPETPWAFLYRNPVEILVSQMRQRGSHTVAGLLPANVVGIDDADMIAPERYVALILSKVGGAILDHWRLGGGLLVNYAELPGAAAERLFPHFGIESGRIDMAAVSAVAARNAKFPDELFVSDTSAKRLGASQSICSAAKDIADHTHDRLEELRSSAFH